MRMAVRSSHVMGALACLLAFLSLASCRTAGASALQSMAAQGPEPDAGQQRPTIAQSTAQQQAPVSANSTQFPASADTFLKALRTLQDAKSLFQASTFNTPSGAQWWSIQAADVPAMRSQAALFAAGLKTSAGSFGGMFAQLIAEGSNVDAARGLAYLLNANLTISGGCPYPPLSARLAQEVGVGLAKAVAMANVTTAKSGQAQQLPGNLTGAMVADAAVAGAMLAAKSCGPPNSLSSGSTEQATRKYLNSTCYFIGPLMVPAVNASVALGRMLNATVEVTQIQDPWGSGAILKAMQECAYGPSVLQQPPTWLSSAIGPIDASQRAMTESVEPNSDSDEACQGQCSNDSPSQMSPVTPPTQAQATGG